MFCPGVIYGSVASVLLKAMLDLTLSSIANFVLFFAICVSVAIETVKRGQ